MDKVISCGCELLFPEKCSCGCENQLIDGECILPKAVAEIRAEITKNAVAPNTSVAYYAGLWFALRALGVEAEEEK